MWPLRLIIATCVRFRIHPNVLTFIGRAHQRRRGLGARRSGVHHGRPHHALANIFDFIDGKVATELELRSDFGGFWDSVMDRFSDISLFVGLIFLYSQLGRTDYVMMSALAMMFSILTSYTRARAESLVDKCKVGLHGAARAHRALHDRRVHQPHGGGAVGDAGAVGGHGVRAHLLHVAGAERPEMRSRGMIRPSATCRCRFAPSGTPSTGTFERATWQYDVMVILILAFVWLTPPDWLGDPTAHGLGPIGWVVRIISR